MSGTVAVYNDSVHMSAFGLSEANEVAGPHGNFDGQKVDVHPKSKSQVELAYEMDDCPTDTRASRDKLTKRDVLDKKKANEKSKILKHYIKRLETPRSLQQYTDYEKRLNRLKQQVALQNQSMGRNEGEEENAQLSYEGENLKDYLLSDISRDFNEVTEQDNVLECMAAIQEFEADVSSEELEQCDKMLQRLDGLPDSDKKQQRVADVKAMKSQLVKNRTLAKQFRTALLTAKGDLNEVHKQEIQDGYNLIPKAAGLVNGVFTVGGKDMSAIDVAGMYRDLILTADDFFEVFSAIIQICNSQGGNVNNLESTTSSNDAGSVASADSENQTNQANSPVREGSSGVNNLESTTPNNNVSSVASKVSANDINNFANAVCQGALVLTSLSMQFLATQVILPMQSLGMQVILQNQLQMAMPLLPMLAPAIHG